MNAVEEECAHVSHVLVIFVAHQRGAVCAVIVGVVGLFHAGLLAPGHAVDNGDVAWCVLHVLGLVVHNAVAVGVGFCAAIHVEAECFVPRIPELGAVGGLYDHVAPSVAVHVGNCYHVVLSCARKLVRPQFHGPQVFPRAKIAFDIAVQGVRRAFAIHDVVHFAITVEVHRPYVVRAKIRRLEGRPSLLEVDAHEQIAHVVVLNLIGRAGCRLVAVGHQGYRNLAARGQFGSRCRKVCVLQGRSIQLCPVDIDVVLGILRLLG